MQKYYLFLNIKIKFINILKNKLPRSRAQGVLVKYSPRIHKFLFYSRIRDKIEVELRVIKPKRLKSYIFNKKIS